MIGCWYFFLCALVFFLILGFPLVEKFRGRGHKVQIVDLALVVVEFAAFGTSTFVFQIVAVLGYQGLAISQDGQAGLGAMHDLVLVGGGGIVFNKVALHDDVRNHRVRFEGWC